MSDTITFEDGSPVTSPASPGLACNWTTLTNEVAYHLFGLRPDASGNVFANNVASADQQADILRCITKGLQTVYAAYRWSFLRPRVNINTLPAYNTGTITVSSGGVVTLSGGSFPSYAASSGGQLWVSSVASSLFYGGTWQVATYNSATSITLSGYTGPAITTGVPYSLTFNLYPLPSNFDSLESELTFPSGIDTAERPLRRTSELEIRRKLERDNIPGLPREYALVTNSFDPTAGSSRSVCFFPIPGLAHTLTAIMTLRSPMIDSVNQYPLGIEVLAPVLAEACLAAAERDIEQFAPGSPEAVHNAQMQPLLAAAIQRDKEYASPDYLGRERGHLESGYDMDDPALRGNIFWNAGGGINGWI
jgi:hypothetical protein